MQTSNCNLDLYVADPVKFLRRYVTENKTCAFHFDSNETTKYVMEAPNLTSSGQISTDHIGHKVMVSVVWDREGMSDNWLVSLVSRQDFHGCILRWISLLIAWNSQRIAPGKVISLALFFNCLGGSTHIGFKRQCISSHLPRCHGRCAWCNFELLSQQFYFAELTLADLHLSRYLKNSLSCAFEDDEAVIRAINVWL